ncbi:hypothetical protein [Jatrophihabitans sp. GAS493]|uniref:hypothetical protein n=1 Tax=Jatrophihabitans sp. GAS493 TaxID=1907575 RepID=UPI0012FDF151|nr:hypothetical protein [Jatrophihabitans sp. GAS493]
MPHPVGIAVGQVADQFVAAGRQRHGDPGDGAGADPRPGALGTLGGAEIGEAASVMCVSRVAVPPITRVIAISASITCMTAPGSDVGAVHVSRE